MSLSTTLTAANDDANRITLPPQPKDEPIAPVFPPALREAIGQHRLLTRQHAEGFRIDQTLAANGLGQFTVLPPDVIAEELRLKSQIIHGQLDLEEAQLRMAATLHPAHLVRLIERAPSVGAAQETKPAQEDFRPGKGKKRTSKFRR